MMSKEFIIRNLEKLLQEFPMIKVSYQLDESTETHFIEVLPKSFFEAYDDNFINAQNEIILKFIKLYPQESLAFVTEDDLFEVDNACFVKAGQLYEESYSVEWLGNEIGELMLNFRADLKPLYSFEQDVISKRAEMPTFEFSFKSKEHVGLEIKNCKNDPENAIEGMEADTYMLAA